MNIAQTTLGHIQELKTNIKRHIMLVEYIIELIDKWERQGVSEDEIVKRILNRWDFDEKDVRGIINYKINTI